MQEPVTAWKLVVQGKTAGAGGETMNPMDSEYPVSPDSDSGNEAANEKIEGKMTFAEFEVADAEQLREKAKGCFDAAHKAGHSWGGTAALLQEAQFYMTELERRESHFTGRRDFGMELIVIVLILGELFFSWIAYREGQQQSVVLQHLQDSSASTADTLKTLKSTMELMNQNIQTQLDLDNQVLLEVEGFDGKSLAFANTGRTKIGVYGSKFRGFKSLRQVPSTVWPGSPLSFPIEGGVTDMEAALQRKKHISASLEVYLENDAGIQYVGTAVITGAATPNTGVQSFHVQDWKLTKRNWR